MIEAYAILSDLHFHDWSQFSSVDENGINTRLQMTLDEVERAAKELFDICGPGGIIFIAGDIFHVRGHLKPSVLNPVRDRLRAISNRYHARFRAIPGNHDLEGVNAERLSSAVTALESDTFEVYPHRTIFLDERVIMVPWVQDLKELRGTIASIAEPIGYGEAWRSYFDLIIHAPVDGVIRGIPSHGLSHGELGDIGFKRVFAGHYHNHVDFGNGVYSIGALTHQTWNDVGSKAGFLIVYDDRVVWRASNAPKFIDLDSKMSDDEAMLVVDGHYVRVNLGEATEEEIKKVRDELTAWGARGIVVKVTPKPTGLARSTSTVAAGASIEESIGEYIKAKEISDPEEITPLCLEVLREARETIGE